MTHLRAEADSLVDEVNSQPFCWLRAGQVAAEGGLPEHGSRIAFVGCGTSRYVAESIAAWREEGGFGESDAFAASEMPLTRSYDVVVAISRSGTTTEVLRLMEAIEPRTEVLTITGSESTPVAKAATRNISLSFADEESVVQTRFATSAIALWRSHFGHDIEHLAELARESLVAPLPDRLGTYEQFVFLGQGPAVGLANEAALEHSLVWSLSELPVGLDQDVLASGATLELPTPNGDPMAELVRAQLAAIALAHLKGIDPRRPRRLSRSIVLK
jgi:D-arabinose 5-phosphate isomerase GutQ